MMGRLRERVLAEGAVVERRVAPHEPPQRAGVDLLVDRGVHALEGRVVGDEEHADGEVVVGLHRDAEASSSRRSRACGSCVSTPAPSPVRPSAETAPR
jgi:hypothetical protein